MRRYFVTSVAALLLAGLLPGVLAAKDAEVTMRVAAGKPSKANYDLVLPRIAQQASGHHLTLTAVETDGSVESTQLVCSGKAEAGIVQRDAADAVQRESANNCAGKISVASQPLYPYYGFLIVSAKAPSDKLETLVSRLPAGKTLNIAVGDEGSGGAVTMKYILKADPAWKRSINPVSEGLDSALRDIKLGSLDGFFVMDAFDSPLIQTVKGSKDFMIADVRPPEAFFATKDWNGRAMYAQATIAPGFFRSTKTITVDAILIANSRFIHSRDDNGPAAAQALSDAADRATASIIADTHTPKDWVSVQSKP